MHFMKFIEVTFPLKVDYLVLMSDCFFLNLLSLVLMSVFFLTKLKLPNFVLDTKVISKILP